MTNVVESPLSALHRPRAATMTTIEAPTLDIR
jgi:hypothetical protein